MIIYMENMKGVGNMAKNLATVKNMFGSKSIKVKKDHKSSLFDRLLIKYKESGDSEKLKIPEAKINNKIYGTGKIEKLKKGKNFHYSEFVMGNVSTKLYLDSFELKSGKKTTKHLDDFSKKIKITKNNKIVPSDEKVTKRASDKPLTEYKFPVKQVGYKSIYKSEHTIKTNKAVTETVDSNIPVNPKRFHGKDQIISLDKTKFKMEKNHSAGSGRPTNADADIVNLSGNPKTKQSDSYGRLQDNAVLKTKIFTHDVLRKTAFDTKEVKAEKDDKGDKRNSVRISKDIESRSRKSILETLPIKNVITDKDTENLSAKDKIAGEKIIAKINITKNNKIVPSDEKVTKRASDKPLTEYKFPVKQVGYKSIYKSEHTIKTNKAVTETVDSNIPVNPKRFHGKDQIISLDKTKFKMEKNHSAGSGRPTNADADIVNLSGNPKTKQSDSYGRLQDNAVLKTKIFTHDVLRKTAFDTKEVKAEKDDKGDKRNSVRISKDIESRPQKKVFETLRLQKVFDKKQSYFERQDQSAVFSDKAVRKTTVKRIKLNNIIDIAENITRIDHQLSINKTALSANEINAFNGSFKGQINGSISNALNFFPQTPTLSVNLYPPKLGRVFLKLSVTNSGIVLRLSAVNAATTTLIKNLTNDLRSHLSKNNISIAKILVATIPQTTSVSSQNTLSNSSNASNWNNNGNKSDFFGTHDNAGEQNGRENLRKEGRRENRQFYGNSYYQGRINLWI